MPDIDIDFCYERRGEVIDYVTKKYGEDHVAQIITFGTFGARQVIRDVARVTRISIAESDRMAKLVPFAIRMTIDKALDESEKFRREYEASPDTKAWIDMARKLEGMPRHSSTHAAGVVISSKPIVEFVPLSKNQKDESITTQYTMGNLERRGLLKMDFLGLRTLTVIKDATNLIKRERNIDIDFSRMDTDDKQVYSMISKGNTDGVFQLESDGMRSLMRELHPKDLGDIMVGISLFRPGPMAKIPDYIAGKNHPEKVTYRHEVLERVLKDTYGCMVYQEQVMEIVRDMAGYSLGRSDLVRRAMAKKKRDVMEKERDIFINGGEGVDGAIAHGVPKSVATQVFNEMMDFAEYAFNKSHACAYAVLAYQTAYLKCHYEAEFMTALLNSYMSNTDRLSHYMRYMQTAGIKLLPPDINKSLSKFNVENGCVRFGLSALKQVGDSIIGVVDERKNGDFEDFEDFMVRCLTYLNRSNVESLILSGCFDNLGANRASLISVAESTMKRVSGDAKMRSAGQLSLFDLMDDKPAKVQIPALPEYDHLVKLAYEKERTGLYISGHPLAEYEKLLSKRRQISHLLRAMSEPSLAEHYDGRNVEFSGILTDVKARTTRARQMMANAYLEDLSGAVGVIFFPRTFGDFEPMIKSDNIVTISAKVVLNEDAPPELIVQSIMPLSEENPHKLYLRIQDEDMDLIRRVKGILLAYSGNAKPVMLIASSGKKFKLNEACDNSDALIDELKTLLGAENVILK